MITEHPDRTKRILYELCVQAEEAIFDDDETFNAFFTEENNNSSSEEESSNEEQKVFFNQPEAQQPSEKVDPEDF